MSGAWRWSSPPTTGLAPTPRAGYASTIHNNELFIAGGWNGQTAPGDAYAFNLDAFHWRQIALRPRGGATLYNRIFFASAAIGSTLFIHGGVEGTNLNERFSDVLALDMGSDVLRPVEASNSPVAPTLQRHSMASRGESLWIVGGSTGSSWVSDVYRLDLSDWLASDGERPSTWHAVKEVGGFEPWGRAHACLIALPPPRPYLLLAAGGDGERDFSDAYSFDLHSKYWEKLTNVSQGGDGLTGGGGGASSSKGNSKAVAAPAVTQAACALLPLPARGGSGSSSSNGGVGMLLHGGFGGSAGQQKSEHDRLDAMHLLKVGPSRTNDAWGWASLRGVGSVPEARMGHALHVVNASCIVLFGGGAKGRHLGDVHIGVPNRLGRIGAMEAEADAQEREQAVQAAAEKEGGEAVEDEESAEEGVVEEQTNEEEAEMVVVRTVRTSDKKRKKGKRRGAAGSHAPKGEL